jgi:hypothetical protein
MIFSLEGEGGCELSLPRRYLRWLCYFLFLEAHKELVDGEFDMKIDVRSPCLGTGFCFAGLLHVKSIPLPPRCLSFSCLPLQLTKRLPVVWLIRYA